MAELGAKPKDSRARAFPQHTEYSPVSTAAGLWSGGPHGREEARACTEPGMPAAVEFKLADPSPPTGDSGIPGL